jgi:hypothetical protein
VSGKVFASGNIQSSPENCKFLPSPFAGKRGVGGIRYGDIAEITMEYSLIAE